MPQPVARVRARAAAEFEAPKPLSRDAHPLVQAFETSHARVAKRIENDVRTEKETPDAVARGQAESTPLVAIGTTAVVLGILFAVALGIAVLAYALAG